MSSVNLINISKTFGQNKVLNGVNLNIEDGEFISFLGPSGCGKTTCLRIIAGLESHDDGILKIDGQNISDPKENLFVLPENRKIGMVFQSYAVWPHMNVFDNIAYPLKIAKTKKSEIQERVNQIMEIVELNGLSQRMPNQLSGGQQQRVALARGLVAQPKVLLLDEPLSNLDAKLREKMRHDIRQIQQQIKITCIYVTHDQIEAFTMSDRIMILNTGRIEQIGTPSEIRNNPQGEFVKDFIS